jgi:hypothetical protein
MGSGTLLEPNILLEFFLEPCVDSSVFYTDLIHIILSRIQLEIEITLQPLLSIKKRLMNYQYTMNRLNSRFTISLFLTFSTYIFLEFISLNIIVLSLFIKLLIQESQSPHIYQKRSFTCIT